jgi:hypothetical protein
MPRNDDAYETAKWRTLWLMVGFTVLVGIGIFTVLRPELEDEASEDSSAETGDTEADEGSGSDEPLQE